jgi:hypothetical protein
VAFAKLVGEDPEQLELEASMSTIELARQVVDW